MKDLKKLVNLSYDAFGMDKTGTRVSDSETLFESLSKLRSDVSNIIVTFKNVENEKIQIETETEKIIKSQNEHEVLTVISYEPPSFTQLLQSAVIQEGQRAVLECKITGFPEPKIEWLKDGISIDGNHDYRTTYNKGLCTLSIDETFIPDSASFTCRGTNSVGMAETTATLSVKEFHDDKQLAPPVFTKYLTSGKAREGSAYEFHCTVEGNPLPEIQWFKNDVCIDNSRDYVITFNNGEIMLRFEEVFLEDKAVYICKAINSVGTDQCWASLDVERKLLILCSKKKKYL